MGVISIVYGLSTSIPFAIGLVMIAGFMNAPQGIARRTIIQRNTKREVRGRVFSVYIVQRNIVFIVGMAAAGLADIIDVRAVIIGAAVLMGFGGLLALVLPGLAQSTAEWRQAVSLLRGLGEAPSLAGGYTATLADFDLLASWLPALSSLSSTERQELIGKMTKIDAPKGTVILRRGEVTDVAYFILEGQALAGREENGEYQLLGVLNGGDFFGEIAALTSMPRTADVITAQPTQLLRVTADTLRHMSGNPELNRIFMNKMTERMVKLNMIDLPRYGGLDQSIMRELRTPEPQPVAA